MEVAVGKVEKGKYADTLEYMGRWCGNYRGMILLSVTLKIYGRVLVTRVKELILEGRMRKKRGFRKVRRLQSRCSHSG